MHKIADSGRSQRNACRNLHSLIHKVGLTLPLRIHAVKIPIRRRKPKLQKQWVHYPVILPTTWVTYLLENHSPLLLAGHQIQAATQWTTEFSQFWDKYLQRDPSHPMNHHGPPRGNTIPLYIHGDEGRGKFKLPIMVQCVQPVISWKGPLFKNSSGYRGNLLSDFLFCTPYGKTYDMIS